MTSDSQGRAILILTAGAICISFAAILVKWIGLDKMGPTVIGFWRTLFGSGFLFLFGLLRGKSLAISSRVIGWAALAGFVFFLDLFFWHRSIIYSGAGLATILANTQVFGTAVLSFFLFKEKLTVRFLIAAVSAMVGVVLLVGLATDQVQFTQQYSLGIIFGLLTGVVYAHYIVILKKAGESTKLPDIVVFIAWTSIFSALYLGIAALVEGSQIKPPDLHSVLILLLLALIAQALGWWAIFTSLKRVQASRAGLILLLQPTLSTIWGMLIFGEQLAWTQVLGGVITLTAIYLGLSWREKRPEPPPATVGSV